MPKIVYEFLWRYEFWLCEHWHELWSYIVNRAWDIAYEKTRYGCEIVVNKDGTEHWHWIPPEQRILHRQGKEQVCLGLSSTNTGNKVL